MDVNSELKDAQLEILDADKAHSANTKGMIWFNRASDKVKAMYNSVVEILATETYVDDAIGVLSGDVNSILSDGLITSERADPTTPASGKVHIYGKTDGVYTRNDSGTVERLYTQADIDSYVGMKKPLVLSGEYSFGAPTIPTTIYTTTSKGMFTLYKYAANNGDRYSNDMILEATDGGRYEGFDRPPGVGFGNYIKVSAIVYCNSATTIKIYSTGGSSGDTIRWNAVFIPFV